MSAPLRVRRSAVEAFVDAAVHGEVKVPAWLTGAIIDLLDEADGDPDVEPNGDERDLSYITQSNGVVIYGSVGDEGDEEDWVCHPSLLPSTIPAPEYGPDQTQPPTNWHGTFKDPWGC